MLLEQRHKIIIDLIKKKEIVKINELVDETGASESTIRRDLTQLEENNVIKRVHGGATLVTGRLIEPSYSEKIERNIETKGKIGKYAANLIDDGDCIYLDAGTSTYEMIKYIDKKNIVVVTNGLKHIDMLIEMGVKSYVVGGEVKAVTKAIVGTNALKDLENYRFDKCFIGINGIHSEFGLTTPDPKEAVLKESAIKLSKESYVLADDSKFGEVTFVKVSDIKDVAIVTNEKPGNYYYYAEKTKIKVVDDL